MNSVVQIGSLSVIVYVSCNPETLVERPEVLYRRRVTAYAKGSGRGYVPVHRACGVA